MQTAAHGVRKCRR